MLYVIAYDIGTTGLKTCLFSIGETIEMIAGTYSDYDLYILENGGAEQDADQWWQAMCEHHAGANVSRTDDDRRMMIDGISFCSQMQGLVLVDWEGRRPAAAHELHGSASRKGDEGVSGPRPAGYAGVNAGDAAEEPGGHARRIDERTRIRCGNTSGSRRTSRRSFSKGAQVA